MASAAQVAKTAASRQAIHRALPGPKGDKWATAQAVADATGLKYSTVTEHLRAMVDAGAVGMDRQGRVNVFRKTAASPKLKATDVPTPRAAGFVAAQADAKKRRGTTRRPPPIVEPPTADVAPAPDEPAAGELVWMATKRKGLNYHTRAVAMEGYTVCGRSMRTGSMVPLAEVRDTSPCCPVCERGVYDVRRSEVTAEPEPVAVPQPPPAANTPTGGDVGSVVDYLESVRPVSAAPAEPEKKARSPRAASAHKYAEFARGELQAAILTHVQALPEGTDATPYEVATALNAYPGAVAYGLGRLVVKGNVRQTSDKPQRYAAV